MQPSASVAAPHTASDPLWVPPISPAAVFWGRVWGFLGEEKETIILFAPQLTDLLKGFPLETRWRVLEGGSRALL